MRICMPNIISQSGIVVGQEFDDKYCGKGTCNWEDGSQYVGEWRNGRMHGRGSYTACDGDVLEGIFLNGSYIGIIEV